VNRDEQLGEIRAPVAAVRGRIEEKIRNHRASPDVASLLSESRRNSVLAVVTPLLAVIAVAMPFVLLPDHLDEFPWFSMAGSRVTFAEPLLIAGVALVGVVVIGLLVLSDRYRRASRAAAMRAHERSMLKEYEKPLTTFQAQILRIALAHSLFVGTSDRLDALIEPEWLDTKELIALLRGAATSEDATGPRGSPRRAR
jgi:hypothetical protein